MRSIHAFLFLLVGLCVGGLSAQSGFGFERQQIADVYLTEGAAIGDLDGDGIADIAAGTRVWTGPDFTRSFDIAPTRRFRISTYTNRYFTWILDVDQDGWNDVLTVGIPGNDGHWFRNPGRPGSGEQWPGSLVAPSVQTESPTITQLIASGPPELVCAVGDRIGFLQVDPAKPDAPWGFHPVSGQLRGLRFLHGLGVGDLNGDGRADVLTKMGWFEQPEDVSGDPIWAFHPHAFAAFGGAQMLCFDIDGDSDRDVVSSLHAHGYGLSWFENLDGKGLSFREHRMLPLTPGPAPQFSQLHALLQVDLDGDGLQDFVTGKTFFAHNGNDPGALDPAVLVWFRLVRDEGGARFEQIELDDDSGVGRQLQAADLDGDGRPELITSNKKGVFRFRPKQLRSMPVPTVAKSPTAQAFTIDVGRPQASRPFVLAMVRPGAVGVALEPWAGLSGVLDAQGTAQPLVEVPGNVAVCHGAASRWGAVVLRPGADSNCRTNVIRFDFP